VKSKKPRLIRLRGWLLPTLVGPPAGAALFVVLHGVLTGAGFAGAVAELVASGVIGFVLGAVLALVDFGLLVSRFRSPPTHGRAWLSSMGAGAASVVLWRLLRPALLSAPSSHLLALLGAVLIAAVVTRLITSPKPSGWFRFS